MSERHDKFEEFLKGLISRCKGHDEILASVAAVQTMMLSKILDEIVGLREDAEEERSRRRCE